MSLFECLHVRFDSFSKFFSIFFFQVSSKHLKEVPLLGLAKAKALALSNANLLARNIDPQKISPLPYCQPYIQFCVLPPSIAINLPDIASLRITL